MTAHVARVLAQRTGAELVIVGRRPLPSPERRRHLVALDEAGVERESQALLQRMRTAPGFTPKRWQHAVGEMRADRELTQNLDAIERLGVQLSYVAVDLADPAAVQATLPSIVDAAGPIEGLLHGAGYEVAAPLDRKSDEVFARTVGPKLSGFRALIDGLDPDRLTHVVGFGSVSGRFGGHGQVDYAIANEGLAAELRALRARRPGLRACCVDWAAFSEVGLAARSSAKAFLEATGQAFMTPAEGAEHLFDELAAGLPEPELVICHDLAALDLDATLSLAEEAPNGLLGLGRGRFEVALDPAARLLAEHRIGPAPVLPAAGMAELLLRASASTRLEEFSITQALRVTETQNAQLSHEAGGLWTLAATPRRPGGRILEPLREHARGRSAAPSGQAPAPLEVPRARPDDLVPLSLFG